MGKKKSTKQRSTKQKSTKQRSTKQKSTNHSRKTFNIGAPNIRLSQCMIVKNEEKNIERALGWAKGIAFEQIVVDTGSTDRTVELAKALGAKVYHFQWINDFSAAKNYAIEQATGDWIAFLDADEYFLPEHAKKLPGLLKTVEEKLGRKVDALRTTMSHLNDESKQIMASSHTRIFRNSEGLRFHNAIHETLMREGEKAPVAVNVDGVIMYHTGYTRSTYAQTSKIERNISMIREQLEKDPENPMLMCYLLDSLLAGKHSSEEAQALIERVIESRHELIADLRHMAYRNALKFYAARADGAQELVRYANIALEENPGHYDYTYYLAFGYRKLGDIPRAQELFERCEDMLTHGDAQTLSLLPQRAEMLFKELLNIAGRKRDIQAAVRYATLFLKKEKYDQGILSALILDMPKYDSQVDANTLFGLLEKLYDFTSLKDKLFTLKCAKLAGNAALAGLIYDTFLEEERTWFES